MNILSKEEQVAYEASLKAYRDSYAIATTERRLGFAEGEANGIAKGKYKEKIENARNFKLLGVDPAIIAKGTGLSLEEIERL